ncbi:hypothetical protein F4679DRAFT_548256, partial [Xylaria curta]
MKLGNFNGTVNYRPKQSAIFQSPSYSVIQVFPSRSRRLTIIMSGVRGWFGNGTAKKQEDTPKNAIVGLRTQLEILRKREKHLTTQIEEQDVIARRKLRRLHCGEKGPTSI